MIGVGTALLQAAETWLSSRPDLVQTMSLGVETDNTIAIALYAKLGYALATRDGVPIVFNPGRNGRPCHVMFKRLGEGAGKGCSDATRRLFGPM